MRQPEPCCGGLVTPTVDELLAVARNKPLPRMKVRERRPPPAKVGATLKGRMSWQLIDRRGREIRGGDQSNLILDQGLDQVAEMYLYRGTGAPPSAIRMAAYCAVGTDSTAPDPSQTALGSEVARTSASFAADTLERPSPGVYVMTRHVEFDYNEANGNLTEWGFSPYAAVAANLFNRELFRDGEGTPDPVTKTSDEKLRITYALEIALSPVDWTAGSFELDGVGTVNGMYRLVGAPAPSGTVPSTDACEAPDLRTFSALARDDLGTVIDVRPATGSGRVADSDQSGVAYTDSISAFDSTALVVARQVIARDAYTPGSFTRTGGSWVWDTGYGNRDPVYGIQVWGASTATCTRAGYVFAIDGGNLFEKDDEHTLEIGVPIVTWGRGSS